MATSKQKVLNTLAALQQRTGREEHDKTRVRTMADIKQSTFPSLITRMVGSGLIKYGTSTNTIKLTEEGFATADPIDVPTSDEKHHEKLKLELKGKVLAIFEYLADGKVHDKTSVMEAVDCTNPKTFAPLVSRSLAKKGLVHYPTKGTIALTDDCFPCTRGGSFDE